jgi:hypothetical protein
MRVLEFARSSVTFRIDLDRMPPKTLTHKAPYPLNNARVLLDSRLRITERATGRVHTIAQGASCKTERVGAPSDLWLEPNGDFVPIFSDTAFMNIKTFARAGTQANFFPPGSGSQSDRQSGVIDEVFDRVHLDLVEREGEPLETPMQIVHAVLANEPLVAVNRIENERYTAEIEYPVKTINANEHAWIYQTDTGPFLYPDLTADPADLLTRLELAFGAFNAPDWGEFIVRTRTAVGEGIEVYHFSRPIRLDGIQNTLYRVPVAGLPEHRRVELTTPR